MNPGVGRAGERAARSPAPVAAERLRCRRRGHVRTASRHRPSASRDLRRAQLRRPASTRSSSWAATASSISRCSRSAGTDTPLGIVAGRHRQRLADDARPAHRPARGARTPSSRPLEPGECADRPRPHRRRAAGGSPCCARGSTRPTNERANRMRWPRGPRRYDLAIALELLRCAPRPFDLARRRRASSLGDARRRRQHARSTAAAR